MERIGTMILVFERARRSLAMRAPHRRAGTATVFLAQSDAVARRWRNKAWLSGLMLLEQAPAHAHLKWFADYDLQ